VGQCSISVPMICSRAKNEFQKALREDSRYELWRVYGAASEHPIAKRFPDPVNLVREGKLRIDLATLRAVIQPMGTIEVRAETDQPTDAAGRSVVEAAS